MATDTCLQVGQTLPMRSAAGSTNENFAIKSIIKCAYSTFGFTECIFYSPRRIDQGIFSVVLVRGLEWCSLPATCHFMTSPVHYNLRHINRENMEYTCGSILIAWHFTCHITSRLITVSTRTFSSIPYECLVEGGV